MRMSRRLLLVLLPLALSVSGCVSWGNHPVPEPFSSRRLPDPVLLTRRDQSMLTLDHAAVSGDSIVGYAGRDRVRVAVALADVRIVQGKQTDALATLGLATAISLAVVGAAVLVVLASWSPG
jgi:hypothetical protein